TLAGWVARANAAFASNERSQPRGAAVGCARPMVWISFAQSRNPFAIVATNALIGCLAAGLGEYAMPIYMGFFDKPNVLNSKLRGDVTAKGYEGWIEVESAQQRSMGSSRPTVSSGGGGGRTYYSEIVVTKFVDGASVALVQAATREKGKM